MNKRVEVIFEKVRLSQGKATSLEWISTGFFEKEIFNDLTEAMKFGQSKIAPGMSVIVRPTYNEEDKEGKFFQEWRSLDGKEFKNVRWTFAPNL